LKWAVLHLVFTAVPVAEVGMRAHPIVNLIGCHICMEIVAFLYGEQIMLKSAAKIQKCLVSAKYNIPYSADYLFFNVVRQIMTLFLRKNSENTVHIFR